jgi:phenylalanyl-tRNA synthetase beta chain
VLDTLVCMLSEHSSVPFTSESVSINYTSDGRVDVHPKLSYRTETISASRASKIVGVELSAEEIAVNLGKMSLHAEVRDSSSRDLVEVSVGPTRHDVIHACDIYEDIAISYGYDEVLKRAQLPPNATIARQFPLNKLTDALREVAAQAGFTEALTFSLVRSFLILINCAN